MVTQYGGIAIVAWFTDELVVPPGAGDVHQWYLPSSKDRLEKRREDPTIPLTGEQVFFWEEPGKLGEPFQQALADVAIRLVYPGWSQRRARRPARERYEASKGGGDLWEALAKSQRVDPFSRDLIGYLTSNASYP